VQKVKCLYVKLVNQMLTKKQLKMGNGFWAGLNFFVIDSDEVKETILDFILYKEIDILTMVSKEPFFKAYSILVWQKNLQIILTFPFWRFLWRIRVVLSLEVKRGFFRLLLCCHITYSNSLYSSVPIFVFQLNRNMDQYSAKSKSYSQELQNQ
jgi:hypothetical protein